MGCSDSRVKDFKISKDYEVRKRNFMQSTLSNTLSPFGTIENERLRIIEVNEHLPESYVDKCNHDFILDSMNIDSSTDSCSKCHLYYE